MFVPMIIVICSESDAKCKAMMGFRFLNCRRNENAPKNIWTSNEGIGTTINCTSKEERGEKLRVLLLSLLLREMTLIQSTKPKQSFPNYEATEDFLDFSRWKLPHDERVVTKRLRENLSRFSGNYICLYLALTITYAILLNWKILAAAATIAGGGLIARKFYFYIYLLEGKDNYHQGLEKKKSRSGSHPSNASATIYGCIVAALVLYQFSVVTPLVMILFITMKIACLHAVARPFVGEHSYLRQPRS